MDIGESIVGAYMRYIRECEVVVYNTFLRDRQREIDVAALKTGNPREVWLCEVTTHIGGMPYAGNEGGDGTISKLRDKRTNTDKMRELSRHARKNSSATSEPAYRMLQVLTHLRGATLSLESS